MLQRQEMSEGFMWPRAFARIALSGPHAGVAGCTVNRHENRCTNHEAA